MALDSLLGLGLSLQGKFDDSGMVKIAGAKAAAKQKADADAAKRKDAAAKRLADLTQSFDIDGIPQVVREKEKAVADWYTMANDLMASGDPNAEYKMARYTNTVTKPQLEKLTSANKYLELYMKGRDSGDLHADPSLDNFLSDAGTSLYDFQSPTFAYQQDQETFGYSPMQKQDYRTGYGNYLSKIDTRWEPIYNEQGKPSIAAQWGGTTFYNTQSPYESRRNALQNELMDGKKAFSFLTDRLGFEKAQEKIGIYQQDFNRFFGDAEVNQAMDDFIKENPGAKYQEITPKTGGSGGGINISFTKTTDEAVPTTTVGGTYKDPASKQELVFPFGITGKQSLGEAMKTIYVDSQNRIGTANSYDSNSGRLIREKESRQVQLNYPELVSSWVPNQPIEYVDKYGNLIRLAPGEPFVGIEADQITKIVQNNPDAFRQEMFLYGADQGGEYAFYPWDSVKESVRGNLLKLAKEAKESNLTEFPYKEGLKQVTTFENTFGEDVKKRIGGKAYDNPFYDQSESGYYGDYEEGNILQTVTDPTATQQEAFGSFQWLPQYTFDASGNMISGPKKQETETIVEEEIVTPTPHKEKKLTLTKGGLD